MTVIDMFGSFESISDLSKSISFAAFTHTVGHERGITEKKTLEFIHGNERDEPCLHLQSIAIFEILRERMLNTCSFLRDAKSHAL